MPRVVALFDYNARNDDELSFSVGDIISLDPDNNTEDRWWHGTSEAHPGASGRFPVDYVSLINETSERTEPAVSGFAFAASSHDEVSLEVGQEILLINPQPDAKWYNAEAKGRRGKVPANCVSLKDKKQPKDSTEERKDSSKPVKRDRHEDCHIVVSVDDRKVSFSWTIPDKAPVNKKDWIGLYVYNRRTVNKYSTYIYTEGRRSGNGVLTAPCVGFFDLRFYRFDDKVERARSQPFCVGKKMDIVASYLGVDDHKVIVTWNKNLETKGDWIALFPTSARSNKKYNSFFYTSQAQENGNSLVFDLPKEPGDYEFRYFFSGSKTGLAYAFSGFSNKIASPRNDGIHDIVLGVTKARAIRDYEKEEDGRRFAFRTGDVLRICFIGSDGRWFGECEGKYGWFPSSFVNVVTEDEQSSSSPPLVPIALVGVSFYGGKTSLVKRYFDDEVYDGTPTSFMNVRVKNVVVQGSPLRLQIFDTSGLKKFRQMVTSSIFSIPQLIFICHDVTDKDFFKTCKVWIESAHRNDFKGRLIVVGTKCDLVSEKTKEINRDEAERFFSEMNPPISYYETSAKTGEGVNDLFDTTLRKVVSDKRKYALSSTYPFEKLLESPSCVDLKAAVYRFFSVFQSTSMDTKKEVDTVRSLITDIAEEMKKLEPWSTLPENHFLIAKDQMEKFVFANVYPFIHDKAEYQSKDAAIRKHHDEIKSFVTPFFLDMNEKITESEFIPTAIGILSDLHIFRTPTEKLQCIFSACRVLSYLLVKGGREGAADDFLPLCIFVVVNTPFKSLYSDLRFIELFCSSEERSSEPYYFFTSMYSAMLSLENESVESISKTVKRKQKEQKLEEERKKDKEEEERKKLLSSQPELFRFDLPKERMDEWTNTLSRLEDRTFGWEESPISCVMIESDDGDDIDESLFVSQISKQRSSVKENGAFFFGTYGSLLPVNTDLTTTIRLTLKDAKKTSFRIATRKNSNLKYSLSAFPSEGTLGAGESVDVQLVLRVMCTTSFTLCLPVVIWRGTSYDYESLIVSGRGNLEDVFVCQLESDVQSLPSTRLDALELILNKAPIGEGQRAVVYRGTYRGIDVACKVLKDQEFLTSEQYRDFKREVGVFESIRHPCILTFIGAVFVPRSLSFVFELSEYGSLDSAIAEYGLSVWTMKLRMKALLDIAHGMEFLHQSRIVHLDLKPANLLVVSQEVNSSVVCKLSGFGQAATDKASKTLGILFYQPPEVLKGGENCSWEVDAYSFGIIMAFVADCKEPFRELQSPTQSDFIKAVVGGKRPIVECESEVHADYISLMHACWDKDPKKRPAFHAIAERIDRMVSSLA